MSWNVYVYDLTISVCSKYLWLVGLVWLVDFTYSSEPTYVGWIKKKEKQQINKNHQSFAPVWQSAAASSSPSDLSDCVDIVVYCGCGYTCSECSQGPILCGNWFCTFPRLQVKKKKKKGVSCLRDRTAAWSCGVFFSFLSFPLQSRRISLKFDMLSGREATIVNVVYNSGRLIRFSRFWLHEMVLKAWSTSSQLYFNFCLQNHIFRNEFELFHVAKLNFHFLTDLKTLKKKKANNWTNTLCEPHRARHTSLLSEQTAIFPQWNKVNTKSSAESSAKAPPPEIILEQIDPKVACQALRLRSQESVEMKKNKWREYRKKVEEEEKKKEKR